MSYLIKLLEINKTFENIGLDLKVAEKFITTRFIQTKNYLNSLADVLATGYVDGRIFYWLPVKFYHPLANPIQLLTR